MTADASTFDYIVVGSGSAGAAVAARLSESGRHTVLLLEAGPEDRSPFIRMPLGYSRLVGNPRYDWMVAGEPEPGLGGRRLVQPRGKVLGGTSAINGMVYTRGVPADYDRWRQLGCAGCDWDSVLPFFRRAENNERGADHFHGVGGPLNVSDRRPTLDLIDKFVDAAVQAGLPRNRDFNGAGQEGVGYHQYTIRRGQRWSAAHAYLHPARRRASLAIRTEAQATRILLDRRRAVGVEYRWRGGPVQARARGEVIVCGGSLHSPQLLQLSGIGPGPLLQQLGIDAVLANDLVGRNLQDHYQTHLDVKCRRKVTLNDLAHSSLRQAIAAAQYFLFRRGPLSGTGIYAGAYVRTDPRLENPDLAINFFPWSNDPAAEARVAAATHPFSGFSFCIVLQRPDSRGEVAIGTPDPFAPPRIRYNFPGSDLDLDTMVEGLRIARRIAAQPALSPYTEREVAPGGAVTSQQALRADVLARVGSALHVAGTCQMGPEGRSVVDERLRVRGIDRLRVADASIMPVLIAGNTNAPTIMIGEKAAAMILEDA